MLKSKLVFLAILLPDLCIGQINKKIMPDSLLEVRKDSISSLRYRLDTGRVTERYYIIDSTVIINGEYLYKFTKHKEDDLQIFLVDQDNNTEIYLLRTGKAFILNNKLMGKFAMMKLYGCSSLRVRTVSFRKVKKRYEVNNVKGAFSIICHYQTKKKRSIVKEKK